MNKVGVDAFTYCKNFNFSFTKTLRGENVDLSKYDSSTFIIDVDGIIYQGAHTDGSTATVSIVGGIDRFVNSRNTNPAVNFYITEPQKVTLYKIMKALSQYADDAQIQSSDSDKLEQSLNALYFNYCG